MQQTGLYTTTIEEIPGKTRHEEASGKRGQLRRDTERTMMETGQQERTVAKRTVTENTLRGDSDGEDSERSDTEITVMERTAIEDSDDEDSERAPLRKDNDRKSLVYCSKMCS